MAASTFERKPLADRRARAVRRSLGAGLLALALVSPASAADWRVETVRLPSVSENLIRSAGSSIEVQLASGTRLALERCGAKFCLTSSKRKISRERPPKGALPDGIVAIGMRNIARAWLAGPTRRYGHAVLGDAIEAGAIVAVDAAGRTHRLSLGGTSVFEDLLVRLADVDTDGVDELLVVRSYLSRGAALAVIELAEKGLSIAAETPPIGRPNRWLNPAGIADFDGDGRPEIAIVVTPHIGGRLEFWTYAGQALAREASANGFSNHAIGSRVQAMSAIADFDGDGTVDLALPSADRRAIRIMSLAGGRLGQVARVALPGAVVTELLTLDVDGSGTPAIVAELGNRTLAILRRDDAD